MPQPVVSLPRGSILYIEAKDLGATPAGTVKTWNKVTEHKSILHWMRSEEGLLLVISNNLT